MCIRTSYRHTMAAAYIGYVTQAIINNFAPLLFLTFSTAWDIPLTHVAVLVAVNFGVQITVDLACAPLVDRIGYRPCIVAAHLFAAAGLVGLGVFPLIFASPFAGVVVAVVLYAIGGGLTEVLISPIVEACPTEHKEAEMSLLHSFYCWGHVFVILASTLFFTLCGIENWAILACLWALVPLFNAVYFSLVPIRRLGEGAGEGSMPLTRLLRTGTFWLFIALMFCAGAAEQAMSQWASAFAEAGLHVSKTVGDLAGPCMFAVLMGTARLVSARLERFIPVKMLMGICWPVPRVLPAGGAFPVGRSLPRGVRAVRPVGGHYVARDVQHGIVHLPTRRHGALCPACPRGGRRMHGRPLGGGAGHRSLGGRLAQGRYAGGVYVPHTARAGADHSLPRSETVKNDGDAPLAHRRCFVLQVKVLASPPSDRRGCRR